MAEADATGLIRIELDNSQTIAANEQIKKTTQDAEKAAVQSLDKVEKAYQELGKTAKTSTDTAVAATQKLSGVMTELAKKDRQIAAIGARGTEQRLTIAKQGEVAKDLSTKRVGDYQLRKTFMTNENIRQDLEVRRNRALERVVRAQEKSANQAQKEAEFAAKQASPWYALGWQAKTQKQSASSILFGGINQNLGAFNLQQQMVTGAARPSQTWQMAMNAAIARANATNANFFAQQAAAQKQLAAAGGAGGGFFGRGGLGRRLLGGGGGGILGGFASGLLGGMGIGLGGYAAARAIGGTIEATETAVAYDRQRVAAENLAGSQAKLNALLDAYSKASGGAIDKSTTLGNVTRLLATGFAESVPDVDRFVKATRGASIALGRPQDYVIQETQLAISNTSVKRLDQIGLGIVEVQKRIKELRKENREWTREQAFQEAVLGLMEEKYGKLTSTLEGQKTGLEQLRAAWSDLMLAFGQGASGPINAASRALSNLIRGLLEYEAARERAKRGELQGVPESQLTPAERRAQLSVERTTGLRRIGREWWDSNVLANSYPTPGLDVQMRAQRVLDNPLAYNWPMNRPRGDMPGGTGAIAGPPAVLSFEERMGTERANLIRSTYDAIAQVDRDYSRARLAEIRQYESQRASIIRDFNKQNAREEEDFQRSRARSLRDYERAIVDVMRDSQKREADLLRDYNENLADLQADLNDKLAEAQDDYNDRLADIEEDSNERRADIEEKYQKDRERAERDHRDRLLSAASQLNAIAVMEEQKRYKRESEEREEGHKDALEEERESLEERKEELRESYEEQIEDARKAHDKQVAQAQRAYERSLEEGRQADAERLEDMRIARAQQLADEDEDRAIRKARAVEDHNDQLAELDRQHELTMIALKEQAAEQRKALEDALARDLDALGYYIEGYNEKMAERDKAIEEWFDKLLDKIEKVIEADAQREANSKLYYPGGGPGGGRLPAFANGGYVPFTGPALLHAGEFVLSRDMLSAGVSNSNRSITIESGAIQVYGAIGQSAEEIALLVNRYMTDTFRELAAQ